MALLYVATLTVWRDIQYLGSLPYLCTKNETVAPLYVATLTVWRELPDVATFSDLNFLYFGSW